MLSRVFPDSRGFREDPANQDSISGDEGPAEVGRQESQVVRFCEPRCRVMQLGEVFDDPERRQMTVSADSAEVQNMDAARGLFGQEDVAGIQVLMMQARLMHGSGNNRDFANNAAGFQYLG